MFGHGLGTGRSLPPESIDAMRMLTAALQGNEVRHHRAPLGQGARFVQGDGLDPMTLLQIQACLEQDSATCRFRKSGHNEVWRREH